MKLAKKSTFSAEVHGQDKHTTCDQAFQLHVTFGSVARVENELLKQTNKPGKTTSLY